MTILEQLKLRVDLAAKNLRNELIAAKQDAGVLPVSDIKVKIVEGGVRVYFTNLEEDPPVIEKPADDKPKPKSKAGQYSK